MKEKRTKKDILKKIHREKNDPLGEIFQPYQNDNFKIFIK